MIKRLLLYPKTIWFHMYSTLTPKPFTKTTTFSFLFQECSHRKALNVGKQAHARMLVSGFSPTVFVSNCLMQFYVKCSHLSYAHKMFDRMTERDVVSCNVMIYGYANCGEMRAAKGFFDRMRVRDVVSWNSMISGFLQNGECEVSVEYFLEMGRVGIEFDGTTFAIVLKVCASLEDLWLVSQIHGVMVRMGVFKYVVAGTALVDVYAKCNRMNDSLTVFNEIPDKNWVSWSAMIAGSVQNEWHNLGLELFKDMQKEDIEVGQSIYASLFRSCAGLVALKLGTQLHGHALKNKFASDIIVGTSILDMYAKCGCIANSKKLFDSLPKHSLQSYNAIIVGYARSDCGLKALYLFRLLLRSGLGFDEISLSGVFSACASIKRDIEGRQIHGLVAKSKFSSNICVINAILDMYGKCGAVTEAFSIFAEMKKRDAVSWNAIIAAYEQNGKEEETLSCFASMLRSCMEPDEFTYGSALKACAGLQTLESGMEIHTRAIKSGMGLDSFVGGALVDMYCKCGKMEEAFKIHDRTEEKTIVSWNALISGYSSFKQSEDAQDFFSWMLKMGETPDEFTYASILDTCANLATISLGKQIHAQIIKQEMQSDVYISSTLVDMYSKCGNLQDSRLIFEKAPKRDFVTWNSMICGYSQHGHVKEAVKLFEDMQIDYIKPNHATFLSVLRACAHMGLDDKGMHYFDAMQSEYGLDPQLEHYSCMVDLLGKSGRIHEALKLIEDMPFEADSVIWRTVLSICKIHGSVEIAEKATQCILKLDPEDSSAYILLSNIYADAGMWDKVSDTRKLMRHNKLKKEPGCSWIEVKDEVHTFLMGDKAHPNCEEIYEKLRLLIDEMKLDACVTDADIALHEGGDERERLKSLETSCLTMSIRSHYEHHYMRDASDLPFLS